MADLAVNQSQPLTIYPLSLYLNECPRSWRRTVCEQSKVAKKIIWLSDRQQLVSLKSDLQNNEERKARRTVLFTSGSDSCD